MKRVLIKLLVAVAVLGIIGFAFLRSVRSTREQPYTVAPTHLQQWEFAIQPGNAPTSVLVSMRPPRELAASLFRQLFTRHAESFNGVAEPFVPLVLQDEFNRSFAGQMTSNDLLGAARAAGLGTEPMQPRCMGYVRDSAPGVTRQLYYVRFDAPAFTRFREQIATRAVPDTGFRPDALAPAMFVAASDANFNQWLSVSLTERDCVAPISVESSR